MFRHYLTTVLKQIFKFRNHRTFSLLGLVIGLASVFIISSWALEELRYDRFHDRPDHLYMVTTDVRDNTGNLNRFPETPGPLADVLGKEIPQIESAIHFLYLYGGREISSEEVSYREQGIAATPGFLQLFNFPLIEGVAADLDEPDALFLSRRLADKLFPEGEALGRSVLYKDEHPLVVKGIFRNVPRNSSLQFDFLIPYVIEYGISDSWWQLSDATFFRVARGQDDEKVRGLMRGVWREHITDDLYDIGMISIADLRYGADFEFFNASHGQGNRNRLYMFLGVALMILTLACLNYLNLVSAYAIKRENEIWIRKVQGASRRSVVAWFLLESVLLSVLAWILAALLSLLALRGFESLLGISVSREYFYLCTGLGLFVSVGVVGLATGFYPALRAGSRLLVRNQREHEQNTRVQTNLRNVFALVQFILSISLVTSSLIIIRQVQFMRDYELGYTRRNIVNFSLPRDDPSSIEKVRNYLEGDPGVAAFSFGSASPVNLTVLNTTEKWRWEGLAENTHTAFFQLRVDAGFADVFRIPVTEGRFFTNRQKSDNCVVINEKLAKMMELDDLVGRTLSRGDQEFEIIGVVRNFHFQHLANEIRPLVLLYGNSGRHLFVRFNSRKDQSMAPIRNLISGSSDGAAAFTFIRDEFDKLYHGEQQMLAAILIFTFLSILLSILGLIGVVAYSTEVKTREIAIRKVFGAGTGKMVIALNGEILKF